MVILCHGKTFGQLDTLKKDTLRLSLERTEYVFLQRNFVLLAQKYNINMAEAAVIQARLWYNPQFFYESVLFNPNNHKLFDYSGQNGQVIFQVQQMIFLAGKRSKLIKLAELNKELEQLAFEDILRALRFQLYSDYATIYTDLKKIALLKEEEERMKRLVLISELQYSNGVISGYDLTRIQYEHQSIIASINDLFNEIINIESELKLMLSMDENKFILPASLPFVQHFVVILPNALDSAEANRPDLKVSYKQLQYQHQNLTLQKALAVPDLTLGTNYDRYGNAFKNYIGANVSIDLPVFNRNQGNIKIASVQVDLATHSIENAKLVVRQDVTSAYEKLQISFITYNRINSQYKEGLKSISVEAIKKYEERIIGLLEFIDKIRTYKSGQLNIFDIELNLFLDEQYFNFVTNSKFY